MRMPLGSVLQMLCSINYILNDENLELKDITIFDGEQSEMTSQLESARSENELSQPVNNPQNAQNTYLLEQQILKMVRTGDTEGLKKWMSNACGKRGNSSFRAAEAGEKHARGACNAGFTRGNTGRNGG